MAHNDTEQPKDRTGYYRVDQDTYRRLEDLAKADDRPVSYLVRAAIEQYLNRRTSRVSA